MITVQADHSCELGAVRQQGKRPTCLAFAASDLNSFSNSTSHLSVEYLCHHAARLTGDWQPGTGFSTDSVLGAVATPGQPHEDSYPYRCEEHDAPLQAPAAGLGPLVCSQTQARGLATTQVLDAVAGGAVVGLVIAVTKSLFYPKQGLIEFDSLVLPDQYHALVAVGTGIHTTTGEPYVLVRNSWGPSWGIAGHAWVPASHLAVHLHEGFRV